MVVNVKTHLNYEINEKALHYRYSWEYAGFPQGGGVTEKYQVFIFVYIKYYESAITKPPYSGHLYLMANF